MRRLFTLILLCVCGCASKRPALSLAHNVDVPKEFRAGNFSEEHPRFSEGNSTIERYVNAYERGWSIAVDRYASDIDFDDPSALLMSGWVEEAAGGADGYFAARQQIEELIRVYGKQKVSAYLQQFKVPDENDRPNMIAPHEPPLPASGSPPSVRRTLDSLPAPAPGGGR